MFENLSKKLTSIFSGMLSKRISEGDFDEAIRHIRVALLESDVSMPAISEIVCAVKSKVIGQDLISKVSPEQMIIKAVHDSMVDVLGGECEEVNINNGRIMLVGLQGAGKTTTAVKLGARLSDKMKKNISLVSLDIYRPAARQQLAILGSKAGLSVLDVSGSVLEMAKMAMANENDILVVDTAGRMEVDHDMMQELQHIKEVVDPEHVILVVDASMGQAMRGIAKAFDEAVGITGIILTKADGDAAGGSVLSARIATGKPILYMCSGEGIEDIEVFVPKRMAGRVLGMGDVVSLVEKASENVSEKEVEKIGDKIKKGQFDMNDYCAQLHLLHKMKGLRGIMNFLPAGMRGMGSDMALETGDITKKLAIVQSMTKDERENPALLEVNLRKMRIAQGAGTRVSEVNNLIKQYQQIAGTVKQLAGFNLGDMSSSEDLMGMLKKFMNK